ncbi:hypothetical protein AbraIFM66950_008494, partial [Aspergillus brasiliensis]
LVETGPIITRFRDVYNFKTSAAAAAADGSNKEVHVAAIDTLISVSTHFYTLLFVAPDQNAEAAGKSGGEAAPVPANLKKNLSPREVHRIIKQGYETLSIQPPEGLGAWTRYREADWKMELKRAARCAVDDARGLVV